MLRAASLATTPQTARRRHGATLPTRRAGNAESPPGAATRLESTRDRDRVRNQGTGPDHPAPALSVRRGCSAAAPSSKRLKRRGNANLIIAGGRWPGWAEDAHEEGGRQGAAETAEACPAALPSPHGAPWGRGRGGDERAKRYGIRFIKARMVRQDCQSIRDRSIEGAGWADWPARPHTSMLMASTCAVALAVTVDLGPAGPARSRSARLTGIRRGNNAGAVAAVAPGAACAASRAAGQG